MDNCFLVKKELIDQTLKTGAQPGKNLLEPLKFLATENKLPFKILEDKDVVNEAEVHKTEGDLWYCLEGEVKFIYGGELVEPREVKTNELKAGGIKGGSEIILKPGDWFWIPAGQPHQHSCSGTARLMIIKIPQK